MVKGKRRNVNIQCRNRERYCSTLNRTYFDMLVFQVVTSDKESKLPDALQKDIKKAWDKEHLDRETLKQAFFKEGEREAYAAFSQLTKKKEYKEKWGQITSALWNDWDDWFIQRTHIPEGSVVKAPRPEDMQVLSPLVKTRPQQQGNDSKDLEWAIARAEDNQELSDCVSCSFLPSHLPFQRFTSSC